MIRTEEILEKIEYFRSAPAITANILEIADNPDSTSGEILDILQFDIETTANVLKLCNSGIYVFQGRIGSLGDALHHIGLKELKKLISMSISVNLFSSGPGYGYETGRGEMRRHSIAVAVVSRHLIQYAPPLEGDLFTTCLLHDTGKLIMCEYIERYHEIITESMNRNNYDFSEAERQVFGITHAEVGARILEKWNFPKPMIAAVRYHHEPDILPDSPLTHFVALADRTAMMMGFTTAVDALEYKGFPFIYKKYKLKESHLELAVMAAVDEIKRAIPFERRQTKRNEDPS